MKISIRPLGIVVLALVLGGCRADADDAVSSAQAFWDALAADRVDAALDHVVPDERDRQRRILERMAITEARVERLEVPPEARVALLPTRVTRPARAPVPPRRSRNPLATITVLRRSGDRWLVDLTATREELQAASVAAVGERLGEAARQLGDALGELGPEIGTALESLGEALEERVDARDPATLRGPGCRAGAPAGRSRNGPCRGPGAAGAGAVEPSGGRSGERGSPRRETMNLVKNAIDVGIQLALRGGRGAGCGARPTGRDWARDRTMCCPWAGAAVSIGTPGASPSSSSTSSGRCAGGPGERLGSAAADRPGRRSGDRGPGPGGQSGPDRDGRADRTGDRAPGPGRRRQRRLLRRAGPGYRRSPGPGGRLRHRDPGRCRGPGGSADGRAAGYRYITLQVDAVDQAHAEALAAGGREGMAPTTLGEVARISFVLEPGGNWIELSQRRSLTGSLEPA
ncbi:MAG: hypothetical protein U5R48_02425 [Gammaproteobacteria bacterium]|nr:hypothetical protein [Gammaproteobacteria bacterium]